MKHSRLQFLGAIAAVAAGMLDLQAKTVAWYHFNEGASGETAAGGQPVVLNAVDPDSLAGKPYVATGLRTTDTTGNLPVYTNDMPSCVSWFDPVTGARGADGRCMFMRANDKKSSYPVSTITVADDEKLHCQTFTAEMMIKVSPESLSVTGNTNWRHLLNMLYDSDSANKRSWGIMLTNDGRIITYINDSDGSFTGSGTSGAAGSRPCARPVVNQADRRQGDAEASPQKERTKNAPCGR